MSCNTSLPLSAIVDEINQHLDNNYVDKTDPRIDQGVFTEPTIRGGLMLDEGAKLDLCNYVAACGLQAPHGKQWVNRPLAPDKVLASYDAGGGDIQTRWESAPTPQVYTSENLPLIGNIEGAQGFNTTVGKPVWWNGVEWVDALGVAI